MPGNSAGSSNPKMNEKTMSEIATQAAEYAKDVVKGQVAKGLPNQGLSKARHVAIVADVLNEMLESYPAPADADESKWRRLVMRAACAGSLLNASQLRQELEKAGILSKTQTISSEYGVE
jgi:hypothetical protein